MKAHLPVQCYHDYLAVSSIPHLENYLFDFIHVNRPSCVFVCKLNQQEQTNLKKITNKHQMNAWLICPGIANATAGLFRSPSILCIELFVFSIQFESNLIMSSFA